MWDVVKVWFGPGSLPFLVIALGVGLLLLRRPSTRQAGRAWIAALLVLYLVLSLPFTAQHLAASLRGPYGPLSRVDGVTHPVAVVVFGGDHQEARVQEASRVYRRLGAEWLVLSGVAVRIVPMLEVFK